MAVTIQNLTLGDINSSNKLAAIIGDSSGTGPFIRANTPTFDGQILVTGGSVGASAPVLNVTQTWNNAAVAFSGIRSNITNTASLGTSTLLDLQVGGTNQFTVERNGSIRLGPAGARFIANFGGIGRVLVNDGSADGTTTATMAYFNVTSFQSVKSGLRIENRPGYGGDPFVTLMMHPTTSHILELISSTNPQTFNIYNTASGSANVNRELGFARWVSNVFEVGTTNNGTGSARGMSLVPANGTVSVVGNLTTTAGANRLLIVNRTDTSSFGRFQWQTNGVDMYEMGMRNDSGFTANSFYMMGLSAHGYPSIARVDPIDAARYDFNFDSVVKIAASTTAKPHMNLVAGVAPTSPANGDIWFDGTDLKLRAGGATYTVTKA